MHNAAAPTFTVVRVVLARLVICAVAALLIASPSHAVNPDEVLDDPVLEERARELSKGIRCMKCQNQSIDESDADLARDLRLLVRERLESGDSDSEVLDYLVDRYGEFVLLKPSFTAENMVLWMAPALGLLAALLIAWRYVATRPKSVQQSAGAQLSREEHDKLTKILSDRE